MSDKRNRLRDLNSPAVDEPRRRLLTAALSAGLGTSLWYQIPSQAAKPPEKMRPQAQDVLVFRFGEQRGQAITPDDVPSGSELLQAAAMEPATGVIRDGSRLNGINLVRVSPDDFDDATRAFVVDDIVAYSSVCTHQGCDLTQWLPETRTFKCYCHYSEFDASQMGEPKHGPAKRKLAILPLALSDAGKLVVADGFQSKVGFKK